MFHLSNPKILDQAESHLRNKRTSALAYLPTPSVTKKKVLLYHHQGLYSKYFVFITYKWSNKLDFYITLCRKGLPGIYTLAYDMISVPLV